MKSRANGNRPNGYPKPAHRAHLDGVSEVDRRRAKEAEEFELDALISESEDDEGKVMGNRKRRATGGGRDEEADAEEGKVRLR